MMNANQPPMAPVCCLCQNGFTEPKVLPCLHTFCLNCLKSLVTDSVHPEVTCPTCGCQVTLPRSGVSGLTTNFIVKRLTDHYFSQLKHSLYGEGQDEGFEEHGQMTRSDTWHGAQVGTGSSGIVPSRSIEGTVSLYALAQADKSKEDVKQEEDNPEATKEDLEKKKEACRVTGKLMSKLMHLQGEALRLTYSIDSVNQSAEQWGERNSEIKSQIVDRSLILQHMIKIQEQRMLAEVDRLESHDQFYTEIDRSKNDLRANLKRVLNGIEFLKHVQNYADEDDVLKMKDFLLGDLKILSNVDMIHHEYELSLPALPSDEKLADYFGSLVSVDKTSFVFEPESSKPEENFGDMKLTQVEKVKQMEFNRASARNRLSRRQRAKTQQIYYPTAANKEVRFASPQRHERRSSDATDLSEAKSEVRADIRDLQEALKQRRRELLEKKAENNLQMLTAGRRPAREKKRRVQSFGGRGSPRTRLMEQAAMAFKVPGESHHVDKQKKLDKTDSMESVDEEILEDMQEEKPQPGDDISTKLKYLRGTWQKRREILRSSESLGDEANPDSPNSDGNTDGESHFSTLQDNYNSIKKQFSTARENQASTSSDSSTTNSASVKNQSDSDKQSYGTTMNTFNSHRVPQSSTSSVYQYSTTRTIQSGGTVTTASEAPAPKSSYSIYSGNVLTTTGSSNPKSSVLTSNAPSESTTTVEVISNKPTSLYQSNNYSQGSTKYTKQTSSMNGGVSAENSYTSRSPANPDNSSYTTSITETKIITSSDVRPSWSSTQGSRVPQSSETKAGSASLYSSQGARDTSTASYHGSGRTQEGTGSVQSQGDSGEGESLEDRMNRIRENARKRMESMLSQNS